MSNVHGLHNDKDDNSDDEKDEQNRLYVGGIGEHGGGRYVARLKEEAQRGRHTRDERGTGRGEWGPFSAHATRRWGEPTSPRQTRIRRRRSPPPLRARRGLAEII